MKDLIRERENNRYKQILVSISNNKKLLKQRKNIVDLKNDINTQEEELRSNKERNLDENYINQNMKPKIYKLFSNDPVQSDLYIKWLNDSSISVQEFNRILPELQKTDPLLNTSVSLASLSKKILNDTPIMLNNIYNLIERIAKAGKMPEGVGTDDLVDRMELYNGNVKPKQSEIIQSNIPETAKVANRDKYVTPPKLVTPEVVDLTGDSDEKEEELSNREPSPTFVVMELTQDVTPEVVDLTGDSDEKEEELSNRGVQPTGGIRNYKVN